MRLNLGQHKGRALQSRELHTLPPQQFKPLTNYGLERRGPREFLENNRLRHHNLHEKCCSICDILDHGPHSREGTNLHQPHGGISVNV